MLRVLLNEARPGMKLAMPVLHPKRGNVLLNRGFTLEENLIRKLQDLEVHEFWIEYPGTDEIQRFVSPAIQQQQGQLARMIAEVFEEVHAGGHARLEFGDYRRALRDIIEELVTDGNAASYILELGGSGDNDLRHGSEVCFLSILLGLQLQDYLIRERSRLAPKDARSVVSLGLGAMVHDVGCVHLDPDTRRRAFVGGDESDEAWRDHVTIGYRMFSGTIKPAAAGVILQHHQYWDGSGFPKEIEDAPGQWRGMKGREIHVFARIVCLANHFDRLRRRPGGQARPRVRVLRELLEGPFATRFDPTILAALPRVVPAFPPGSLVKLSTGEQAAVIDWDPQHPCRPVVQTVSQDVLQGRQSSTPGQRYDLRQCEGLAILEQDGFNVSGDSFTLQEPPAADARDAA